MYLTRFDGNVTLPLTLTGRTFTYMSIIQQVKLLLRKDFMNSNLTVYLKLPAQNSSHRQVEGLLLGKS